MDSLLDSAEVAALFIDRELRVRRFTPALTRFINLMPQDVGWPLGHVTHRFVDVDLPALLQAVVTSGEIGVHDLETQDGKVARLRAVPYRVAGQRVAGVTLGVLDVTSAVHRDATSQDLEAALAHLVLTTPEATAVAREIAGEGLLQVIAANTRMSEAASAAGLATTLDGAPLESLLAALLGVTAPPDLAGALACWSADDQATRLWPLAAGDALRADRVPVEGGGRVVVLRLAPQSDLSTGPAPS